MSTQEAESTDEQVSLDDLYSSTGKEEAEKTREPQVSKQEARTEAQTPAEPAKAEKTGEQKKAPPPGAGDEDDDDDVSADERGKTAALVAERRKRGEWKKKYEEEARRAAEYEQIVRALISVQRNPHLLGQNTPQQTPEQAVEPPDPYADPEAYAQYEQELLQRAFYDRDRAIFETRCVLSEQLMRSSHPDYDEVEAVFVEEAKRNPQLREHLIRHPNPAKLAYEWGKRIKTMREIGEDPEAYIEARVQERLKAVQGSAPSSPRPKAAPPPQSLAGVPSSSTRERPDDGFVPLNELYR
jgi:hypothetical protein